jgi:hypothetical protein
MPSSGSHTAHYMPVSAALAALWAKIYEPPTHTSTANHRGHGGLVEDRIHYLLNLPRHNCS